MKSKVIIVLVSALILLALVGGLAAPVVASITFPSDYTVYGGIRYTPGEEIVSLRTENSKTHYLGDSKRQLVVSIGAIHYKDDYSNRYEQWKDIDLTWEGNRITRAPYELVHEGNRLILRNKRTGATTTIELDSVGGRSIPDVTWGRSRGLARASRVVGLDTDLEIVVTNSTVSFRRILGSDLAPRKAKFRVTGDTSLIVVQASDEDGELPVESSLEEGILTETLRPDRVIKYPVRIDPTWVVSASADDADELAGGTVNLNHTAILLGYFDAAIEYHAGVRFQTVAIPKDSIINTAYLRLYSYTDSYGAVSYTWYGNDVDDASTFTTAASNISGRTRTTASVTENPPVLWYNSTWYNSAEIKTIIAEITTRDSWSSGNDLAIMGIYNSGVGNRAFRTVDFSGVTYSPKLYVDFTPIPDAPTDIDATDGSHTDKVVVTWTKSDDATGYKVYEGANLLDTLGDVATYDDNAAAAGSIDDSGTATASDGSQTAHVVLSLAGESTANGASRTYKVVAFNGAGDSDFSGTDTGYRGVGAITFQWQRSAADSDAAFGAIGGGTTDPYNDVESPVDGSGRWFYCVLSSVDASNSPQDSTHDRGYRDAKPGVTTSAADPLEETTATLKGEIDYVGGGGNASTRGFEWDTDSGAPYASDWHGSGDFGVGAFDRGITGLTEGELYYYRAYATNTEGTGYGDEVLFLTKPDAPNTFDSVVGGAAQIDLTWVKGTGAQKTYIRGKDGSYPTDRADGYLVYNNTLELCSDVGLTGGHAYYYRAWSYATEGGEEQYSDLYDQDSSILTLGLELWYQPETIISGTTLVDRQGSFDGVITWGGRTADGGDFGVLTDSELTQADDYWVGYTLKIKEVAGDATPEGEETEILDSTLVTLGGTADSGTTATLVDTGLTQTTAYWAAQTLTIVTTTDSGAPQGESKVVSSWDLPTNTLTFPVMTAAVDTGDTYTLTAANSLFFEDLTAVVGADARYEIWDGQTILWGSFPEGIKIGVGPLEAYVNPVSSAAGGAAPEVAGLPEEPSDLWGGAASSDLPLYELYSSVATSLGWTTDVLYVVSWVILAVGLGVALLITTGSVLAAMGGVAAGLAGGMATGMLPLWILFVYIILAVGWLYASRSM